MWTKVASVTDRKHHHFDLGAGILTQLGIDRDVIFYRLFPLIKSENGNFLLNLILVRLISSFSNSDEFIARVRVLSFFESKVASAINR